jgi:phosphoribosylcarboxyaminoimidazole (NCAIR) mutase
MEKAAKLLDEMGVDFEMNALSAHRTPAEVEQFEIWFTPREKHVLPTQLH